VTTGLLAMNRIVPVVCAALAFASAAAVAQTRRYHCLPIQVEDGDAAVRVTCAEPTPHEGGYPWDGSDRIRAFAVAKTDADFASRLLDLAHVALTAGLIVQFQYTAGDTSGTSYGCGASSCRRPKVFALLAPDGAIRVPYADWPKPGKTYAVGVGQWHHYGPFSISLRRKLVVTMTAANSGNADLYVSKNEPPTGSGSGYPCAPKLPSSNESCTIYVLAADDPYDRGMAFFVGVRGASATAGGAAPAYTLSVSISMK
jgi:hypothetical protein